MRTRTKATAGRATAARPNSAAGPETMAGTAPPGRQRRKRRLERGVPRAGRGGVEAGVPTHELTYGRWAGSRGELRPPMALAGTACLGAGSAARQ